MNKIFHQSSESMNEIPSSSIHLMVTSPPYNVGKIYDEDLSLDEYRAFIKKVMLEVYRCLIPGGRICLNIANLGRKPYIPLEAYITEDLVSLGFLMPPRDCILDLRHTCASWLYNNGAGLDGVAKWLGHKDPRST